MGVEREVAVEKLYKRDSKEYPGLRLVLTVYAPRDWHLEFIYGRHAFETFALIRGKVKAAGGDDDHIMPDDIYEYCKKVAEKYAKKQLENRPLNI